MGSLFCSFSVTLCDQKSPALSVQVADGGDNTSAQRIDSIVLGADSAIAIAIAMFHQ